MNSRDADDADRRRQTMAAASVLPKLVGQRVKRREDPRLIQGRGTYVDDVKIAGMRHLAFKRSDIAHGRVRSIDTSSAAAMNGVQGVFTGADIAEFLAPMPIGTPFRSPEHRAVAVDTVRFVGDPVAVVVACDRYVARDAADAVVVDYEPLPAVVDPEKAMRGESVVLHAGFPNNVALGPLPSGTGVGRKGAVDDTAVDSAFEAAEVVIVQRMVNQRLAPSSIEARGAVAHYEPGREALTIWSSTQNPHILRTFLARMLGLGEDRVRAIAPEVGGGFGAKINIYGEEYVAAALSKRLGLPVKWIEDRSEAFLATVHGRDLIADVELAAKRDGSVLGFADADHRRYRRLQHAAYRPRADTQHDDGQRHLRVFPLSRATLTEVFTNKTPTDAYRGGGAARKRPYFVERAMDMLAREVEMDPAELRRKNFIQPDQFPYKTQMGAVYDSGDYERALDHALAVAGWKRAQAGARRGPGRRPARRPRTVDVRRELRSGALVLVAARRLGALASHRRAGRPDQRDDRRVAARTGQRDHLRADAGRPVRRAPRPRDDPPRRYRGGQAGHRHLRQPLAGGRRGGAARCGREGEGQDGEVRRGTARGARERSGLRERRHRGLGARQRRPGGSPRSPPTPTGRSGCPRD